MELQQLKDNIYYIPNRTNIGVIRNDEKVILIDSGIDDDTGRKILRTLQKNDLYPVAIINTHSHADHIGGNSYIQKKTGCKIYTSPIEDSITMCPYLEPLYLFSGATPIADLQNKFLMAKPSKVDYTVKNNQKITVAGIEITVIPLPGHSLNQIGIVVDDICFCADAVLEKEVFAKHKIPFNIDIAKQRVTLQLLSDSSYSYFVPSHAAPLKDISQLTNPYLEVLDEIDNIILQVLTGEKTTEEIIKKLLDNYNVTITRTGQYYLFKTITMAHLSSLSEGGKVTVIIKDNILYWKRI
ncbi:MAG: hypothetical protein PWQ96_1815 [Clostridia bacterium]|nr:hypothetical protein [Clostridia bacterium]